MDGRQKNNDPSTKRAEIVDGMQKNGDPSTKKAEIVDGRQKKADMDKRIAIQGVKGCFHEQAARQFYAEHGHIVPEIVECLTFEGLYRRMDEGQADAAVMAIENTVSGEY